MSRDGLMTVCKIKNICMYTAQMEYVGGIESVIRCLLPIFSSHGVACWVACESGSPIGIPHNAFEVFSQRQADRRLQWQTFLKKHPTDIVIFHYVNSPSLPDEILYLKSIGVRCGIVIHSPFLCAFLCKGEERLLQKYYEVAKLCDIVLTVSKLDAEWWSAFGIHAVHIQNPFVHPSKNVEMSRRTSEDGAANILWVGRHCEPKQPKAALAAFALASRTCPELKLTMVGGTGRDNKALFRAAKKLKIDKKVSLIDFRQDISDLWARADIHLLTSLTESFCLVIAEAKAHSVPTVMFDIPFLELVESGKGVLVAPQNDIEGLSAAIVRVAKDGELRRKLAAEAKDSLAEFTDDAVWATWEKAFVSLDGCVPSRGRESLLPSQVYMAWNNYCDRTLWAVRFAEEWECLFHCSFKPFANTMNWLFNKSRQAKRLVTKALSR